jgi:AraC-like DNA-binding protein
MRYWRVLPDPRLRAQIQCYWVMEGSGTVVAGEEILLPDGLSEIVLNRAQVGFERWKLGDDDRRDLMRYSYVIGGRSHSINTFTSKALKLAGVKLDSRFLRELIGTPLSEFRDHTLSFGDLGFAPLLQLEEAVGNAPSTGDIIRLLDSFFLSALNALSERSPTRNAVDSLMRRIQMDRGATAIMRWADDQRIDARRLERGFCAATGMTPKQYARVIRFKHTYRELLGPGRNAPLSSQLDGYYDQSHFNREFRHFTGMPPTVKLAGTKGTQMTVSDHLLQAEGER